MNIIFVNAITFCTEDSPQLGQFILRDILKDQYTVDCINFDYLNKIGEIHYVDELKENIKIMGDYIINQNPRIVGFYTICNAFIISIKLAEYIKKLKPEICIVFGGPQATVTKDECLEAFPFVDVICIGESEFSIKPLINAIVNNCDLLKVPGIAFRSLNGIITTPSARLVSDNELSNYTVYDYSPFKIDSNMLLPMEGGRGCPFSCTFCTTSKFWKRKFRIKPAIILINEMKYFYKNYGVHKFLIHHDLFTANRDYLCDFCNKLIEQKLSIEWWCSSRVDVLDEELIRLMKASKCVDIFLGIETGSQRMQKNINKNIDLYKAQEIIKCIVNNNINVTASFIYCFPDETIDDFKDTIKLMEKCICIGAYTQLHRLVLTPSTEETNKVLNTMYFDPKICFDNSQIAPMLNIVKLDNETSELILRYPNMFSQYYTYDSEVSQKYMRFNYLIDILMLMKDIFGNTNKYLINKYGIEYLYLKMEVELNNTYIEFHDQSIKDLTERVDLNKYFRIYNIFRQLYEEEYNHDCLIFNEVFLYEHYKYKYIVNSYKTPNIIKFKVNIEKILSTQTIQKEDYYVKYYLKNNMVITQHVKPNI
jgi:radical SAM superfamily enzyme YgiQ (UPF0313 family)